MLIRAPPAPRETVYEAYLMSSDDPVEIPIDGVLDLHTFGPKEVKDLVPEYISECLRRGITEIRIIHGKGTGTLKGIVHSILKKDPRVAGFQDADIGAGGWGATIVRLKGRSGTRP
jgi:dsDNA-specific endonuclease/ATPase MutS2